eukprot:9980766-Karenia_brevis.AAC.1
MCWAREWGASCFKCGEKWARGARTIYGRFCKRCYGLQVPEGQEQTLFDEGREYLERLRNRSVSVSGQEPALQLLVLPITAEPLPEARFSSPMPQYSTKAEFLSPNHCRLCMHAVPWSSELVEHRE